MTENEIFAESAADAAGPQLVASLHRPIFSVVGQKWKLGDHCRGCFIVQGRDGGCLDPGVSSRAGEMVCGEH